jgi:CubicO group peptidase (beta-lactamase class C family)
MADMKTKHLLVGVLSIAALTVSMTALAQTTLRRPETVGLSSARLALIRDAVKIQIDAGQIPGAIVLVARDGKVVHYEAQGVTNALSRQPMEADQIFGAGSLTKAVVSVAAMMLVEDGTLNLDDPVSKYIPEFGGPRQVRVLKPGSPPAPFTAMPKPPAIRAMAAGMPVAASPASGEPAYELVPAERPITLRMLLTHTSGIQIYGIDNAFPLRDPHGSLATFVPKLAGVPLEFQPGSRWAYSNSYGFEVVARIIEVASGMNLRQFVQQRLLGPLGMSDTDFGVKRELTARAVPFAPGLPLTIAEEVTDLSGRQYLKPETVKQMASNQIGPLVMGGYPFLAMPVEGLKFGFGLVIVDDPDVVGTRLPAGSFGWVGDGTRLFWAVPEEHIVIVSMVPLIGPQAAPLQRTIEAIVMSSIIRKAH